MGIAIAAWACLLLPLAATLGITLAGTRIARRTAGFVATGATFLSFAAAVAAFFGVLAREGDERQIVSTVWTWLGTGDFRAELSLLVDPLAVTMMLIVSGVGALIVGYSVGYMDGADEERRYFAYMSLFVFSMLLLVLAGNFLILLVGWGLVGLSSYLLIGFEHERPAAIAAAKKAFVMNAVGDATMALAFFVLIFETGTLSFPEVFERADGLSQTLVVLVALGILGGAVAKSAQIPLHTWLPDAMEGPTPVSALIHAATMVTAGVYLLVRSHAVFELAAVVQQTAAVLGAATLLMAGLIGLVQTDIKRVIAYSTMSQIGYMFLGAGLGAYGFAIFHLMTHAFFKALLFLGAGLVIHALIGEQDIRKMGGLRRLMPATWIAMLVGGLALAGIPPFSGFFSKDGILAGALDAGGPLGWSLYAAGLAGAFLTGLYVFRMLFIVFLGEPSAFVREHHHSHHGREGPFSMTAAVAALAVLAVVGGWIQIAGLWHPLSDFLDAVAEPLVEPTLAQDAATSVLAVALGGAGIAVAWVIYGRRRAEAPRAALARRLLEQKFYFDELYDAVFYRPAVRLSRAWATWIERPVIGGSTTGIAEGTRGLGRGVGQVQTGLLRTYVLALAGGAAILFLVFLTVR